jgi:uncharacterized protein (DUF2237 family)
MSLTPKSTLLALDCSSEGLPFLRLSTSSTLSLDTSFEALPFIGLSGGTHYCVVSAAWRRIVACRILISGDWKTVTAIKVLTDGAWKEGYTT